MTYDEWIKKYPGTPTLQTAKHYEGPPADIPYDHDRDHMELLHDPLPPPVEPDEPIGQLKYYQGKLFILKELPTDPNDPTAIPEKRYLLGIRPGFSEARIFGKKHGKYKKRRQLLYRGNYPPMYKLTVGCHLWDYIIPDSEIRSQQRQMRTDYEKMNWKIWQKKPAVWGELFNKEAEQEVESFTSTEDDLTPASDTTLDPGQKRKSDSKDYAKKWQPKES